MVNQSQKRDPRFWEKWKESGAVRVGYLKKEGSEIELTNGNRLNYDCCFPSEGWDSLFWNERDNSGKSTGLHGEIILNDRIPIEISWGELIINDYNQLMKPNQVANRERMYYLKRFNESRYGKSLV
jgi:hypothetical protein